MPRGRKRGDLVVHAQELEAGTEVYVETSAGVRYTITENDNQQGLEVRLGDGAPILTYGGTTSTEITRDRRKPRKRADR